MSTSHARYNHTEGEAPSAKEVLGYLHELLGQGAFNASERNRRFLSYVVEETLEGRADRIKAYNIALAAFDRTAEFDPLTDPIVRIEASRLRRSLEHYYLTAGCADRIRIAIPKGSYAATFSYQGHMPAEASDHDAVVTALPPDRRERRMRAPFGTWAAGAAALACVLATGALALAISAMSVDQSAPSAAVAGPPSLLIMPLEDTSADPSRTFLARGLTYEIGTALTDLQGISVYASEPGFGGTAPAVASDFTLMGSVQSDRDTLRVAIFLMDSHTGRFLQSWSFQKDLAGNSLIGTQLAIAQDIRSSLERDCMPIIGTAADGAVQGMLDCRQLLVVSRN